MFFFKPNFNTHLRAHVHTYCIHILTNTQPHTFFSIISAFLSFFFFFYTNLFFTSLFHVVKWPFVIRHMTSVELPIRNRILAPPWYNHCIQGGIAHRQASCVGMHTVWASYMSLWDERQDHSYDTLTLIKWRKMERKLVKEGCRGAKTQTMHSFPNFRPWLKLITS